MRDLESNLAVHQLEPDHPSRFEESPRLSDREYRFARDVVEDLAESSRLGDRDEEDLAVIEIGDGEEEEVRTIGFRIKNDAVIRKELRQQPCLRDNS